MPKRISADIDMAILGAIGLGQRNKDIAEEYGVSASYVSKLKLGKKVPDIYLASIPTVTYASLAVEHVMRKIAELERELIVYKDILTKYEGVDE